MKKIKYFVSSLHLGLSDLFLAIGFIPMVFFLINGQIFMQKVDPNDVPLSISLAIPLFTIQLLSWGLYIFFEYKNGNRVNKYISSIFILLALIGVIGIVIQPKIFETNMIKANGENALIEFEISTTHYIFFSMYIVLILLFIYIGLFLFPKRFTNLIFLRIIGYLLFIFCIVLLVYSVEVETGNFSQFIKALFSGDNALIDTYALKSFIIHKNAYGMVLLLAIIFCFINHSIEKKFFYFPLAAVLYINMIFTYCKTSLLIAPVISIIYIYYSLISAYNANKKRNFILIVSISSVLFIVLIVAIISYLSKGKYIGFLYKLISSFTNKGTIHSREWIWANTYQLISQALPTSLLFGRGFGLVNMMLLPMNIANNDSPLSFPTHNAYLNLFAEGGFLYLFAYLILLGYVIYISIKCFKKNPSTALAIALGLLSFVLYSLIETIHYLAYTFMFVVLVHSNILIKQDK